MLLIVSANSTAGIINGGDLLDQNGASLLESYLGLGDQNFTNVADLQRGHSAGYWHTLVNQYDDVISIYDVTLNGQKYLIGGYTSVGHGNATGYSFDPNAFIFNLSLDIVAYQDQMNLPQYGVYNNTTYFATFGGGHDLFGGYGHLGANGYGYNHVGFSFGTHGHSYIQATGGLFGTAGNNGQNYFSINGLESYVFTDAIDVPEPTGIVFFSATLVGLFFARRRQQQA